MRLMILEDRRLRDSLRAKEGTITIGSDPERDIHLPDARLGRHQASITKDESGDWWLEVLDQNVPTCLNRAIQKTRAKLRHADEIEMGSFSIRFFTESEMSREELYQERLRKLTKQHELSLPLDTIIMKEGADTTIPREHLEQITLLALRISRMESVNDVLTPLVRALIRSFDARCAWMGIRNKNHGDFDWTLGLSANGQPCVRPPFSNAVQSRCMKHSQHLCIPIVPIESGGSAMAVPLSGQRGNLGMLYVDNNQGDATYNKLTLSTMKAMATCMAMPIEALLQQKRAARRAAIATELTLSRSTQDALTPRALPRWDELQIAAYRYMGTARCCDFYDLVQLRDKTAAIIVAKLDVDLGKVPRVLAEIRAAFRSAALYAEAPHLFARALNWLLFSGDAKQTIHLAAAWVSPTSGQVRYCIAGHRLMVGRIYANGTCEPLPHSEAPPIGQTRAPEYELNTIELARGDSIFLATDGINAAQNADGKSFGTRGLEDNLCDGLGDTPSHVLGELESELTEFLSGGNSPNDITVVMLRRE